VSNGGARASRVIGAWRGGRRISLRRRITSLARVGLGFQLVLVVLVLVTAAVVREDGLRAVRIRTTEDVAASLLTSMADQQTGLLTYLKPAQPDSLLLYSAGKAETETSLATLRADTSGTADAGLESQVEATVRDWQRWADDLHGRQQPVTDQIVIAEGSHLFALFVGAQDQLLTSLDGEARQAGDRIVLSTEASVYVVAGEALAVAILVAVFALQVLRQVLRPLKQLAGAAERVALEGISQIPYRRRRDEIGELARALQGWQEVTAVRTILTEQAPVGICLIGADGQVVLANPALERLLGYPRGALVGESFWTLLHPDDYLTAARVRDGLTHGAFEHNEIECRWLRRDRSILWCSVVTTPVRGADGRPETLVGIIQDITERKLLAERAAQIQRHLLPTDSPELEGYELAAACLPVRDVAGEFYDWTGPVGGHLDLTLADVSTRGTGAALVLATLRMALRTMPPELNPRARVELAAESMTGVLADEGMSVALFHGRLDLGSGLLRYVGAGTGCSAVRRADGQIVKLRARSLPLGASQGGEGGGPPGPVGAFDDQEHEEGQLWLEPGDTLLVYTDGLVETTSGTVELEELLGTLDGTESAEDVVARLLGGVRGRQTDDATVMLLRRVGGRPARAPAPSQPDRAIRAKPA
jgi:PAS domain S-box-containing protein